uniref:helix-turn-helix domain-containing protein n=1 Tax=Corynebacterium belfantii TaxID=2014537 RepID=UPI0018D321E9
MRASHTKHLTPSENAGPYYLGLQERIIIADRLHAGKSIRAIAGELGRAPSTISR